MWKANNQFNWVMPKGTALLLYNFPLETKVFPNHSNSQKLYYRTDIISPFPKATEIFDAFK